MTAGSTHTNGGNWAMGDGSVRFVTEQNPDNPPPGLLAKIQIA